ncbi:hypothetical protein LENED_003020 [Lentinula edodes]|uniref:Uncharacterized protein n=1 Tax=Lentinula edodes TaxID=5353 RepID=A0A1Q3E2P1_LENED|nr:hypothetical protein LENED_003020 [Lentinula edodes]
MLNLWSPLAISTVRAAPLSLNETLIGRMVDGDNNPSHAALLEGCNDPHPLAIRGEGQSKVDRGKDKGKKAHSQSSNNAIEPIPVYFFDCGSIVPFQGATLKPGYLYKLRTNMEIREELKLKKSSKLPETLRQHKKAMDAYDVVIMRQPSGETLYAALLNEEATRLPTLKYDQRHEAEYLEDAWKAMKHAEGYSGSAVASDNDGDWSTDQ